MTATWVRRGERQRVPYENPQRRRYNPLVLYAPRGVQPAWDWICKPRAFTAEDLIHFLLERPACPVPLVIVLDNASLHRSQAVRAALPRLWARGIYFYFLPAYSPELNAIEGRPSKDRDIGSADAMPGASQHGTPWPATRRAAAPWGAALS